MEIPEGKTVGLLGPSGSGKSTVGQMIVGLIEASSGEIFYKGERLSYPLKGELREKIQILFQHPEVSFNPMLPLIRSMVEPYKLMKKDSSEKAILADIRAVWPSPGASLPDTAGAFRRRASASRPGAGPGAGAGTHHSGRTHQHAGRDLPGPDRPFPSGIPEGARDGLPFYHPQQGAGEDRLRRDLRDPGRNLYEKRNVREPLGTSQ